MKKFHKQLKRGGIVASWQAYGSGYKPDSAALLPLLQAMLWVRLSR
jgi:hypothetical protein